MYVYECIALYPRMYVLFTAVYICILVTYYFAQYICILCMYNFLYYYVIILVYMYVSGMFSICNIIFLRIRIAFVLHELSDDHVEIAIARVALIQKY